jgi:hypothetical protein
MQETAEQYISRILGHVDGQDAIKVQRSTAARLKKAVNGLTPKQLQWKPEPGKWSIAEITAHLADTEIVGSWRMRQIIGASGTTVQPFDQDVWASTFQYAKRDAKQSIEVFRVLRENNLAMLKALPKEAWDTYGMHMERGKETLVHIVRMFAGHDVNHAVQIEGIAVQLRKKSKAIKNKTKRK